MRKREVKRWKCLGCEATLGLVQRNGSGVRQLILYRQAILDAGEEVEVMAVVMGTVMDVRCSVCGRVRTWWETTYPPGEEITRRTPSLKGGES